MKIAILGYGVFGSAVAAHLSRIGHDIQAEEASGSELIFVCVPSFAVLQVLLDNKNKITNQKIIICSKGFSENGRLISDVLKEDFNSANLFFLYGPTIAEELKHNIFSGMVLAGGEGKEEMKKQIESDTLRIELTNDIIGVQVGAAMKNAITIFVGIVEGASYGQNTQAYIFTKGVQEAQKLGVALGAEACTFLGLTCLGDLTLRSRNRLLGIELGKGCKLEEIKAGITYPKEGITTIENAKIIGKKLGIDLPFINTLHSIIFEGVSIDEGLKNIV